MGVVFENGEPLMPCHRSVSFAEINEDLARTRKALVTVGCSFAEGQGALDRELTDNYHPRRFRHRGMIEYSENTYDRDVLQAIADEFGLYTHKTDVWEVQTKSMEYENAFINQMALIMDNEWTPVNSGSLGTGNMGSVMKLMLADIDWHLAEEIVLIYMPTDTIRTDIEPGTMAGADVGLEWSYDTMWALGEPGDTDHSKMQYYFGRAKATPAFEYSQFLRATKLLHNWLMDRDGKLITIPAFNPLHSKETLRDGGIEQYHIDQFPWYSVIDFEDQPTFGHWVIDKEGHDPQTTSIFQLSKMEDDEFTCDWLMPCCHPSKAAHRHMAEHLVKCLNLK